MSLTRIVLSCLTLLLLLLVGASIYYYQNFPALVEQQARRSLQAYGVQSLTYDNLDISHDHLRSDRLQIKGVYNGLAYRATLSSLAVQYDWRLLLNGELHSLDLETLELAVTEIAASPPSSPTSNVTVSRLLPKAYIEELPLETIEIQKWRLEYRGQGLAPLLVSGSLRVNDQLRLQTETSYLGTDLSLTLLTEGSDALPHAEFYLTEDDNNIAQLSAILEPAESNSWRWKLTSDLEFAPLLSLLQRSGLSGTLSATVPVLDELQIVGRTDLLATITHLDEVNVSSTNSTSLLSQLTARIETANTIESLQYPGIIASLSTSFDAGIEASNGQFGISLGPTELNANVHVEAIPLSTESVLWLQWGESVPLSWSNPEPLAILPTDQGGWSFHLQDNLLVIGDKKSELRLASLDLNTSITPGEEVGVNTVLSARLNTRLRKKQLPPLNVALSHKGPPTQSDFSFSLDDVAQSMSLSLKGGGDITKGIGRYQLTAGSQDLRYASESILPLLQNFGLLGKSLKLEILSGQMTLESELRSSSFDLNSLKQTSQLEVSNLSGIFDEYRFDGASAVAHWTGTESLQTVAPVKLSIARLDLGFEVTDTLLSLSLPKATPLQQPVINIESFSSNMFGGQVLLPEPASWDFGAKTNHFSIHAQNWRLADMVALQTGQDIRAQGVLEGELPITMTGGRIIIANGFLRALAPGGSIRYVANEASKALAASSPELELAMDLLSDFQYEVLSSRVDLDRDGNLLLGLALAGKNPALYDGRPVNFNINLEQNLDPLLQSLRLSDKLVEQLESRIK